MNKAKLIRKISIGAGIDYADAQRAFEAFENCMRPSVDDNNHQNNILLPIWAQPRKGEGQARAPGKSKHCRYG